MEIKTKYEIEAGRRIKDILMSMNGWSEEDFQQKHINDPKFYKGYNILIKLFCEAKFQ